MFLTPFLLPSVIACGMTTHITISHIALSGYKSEYASILKDYSSYFQAGSFFPDWGYSCANQSDASEMAHWIPFWNTSVAHLRQKYSKPWNKEAKQLIAFIFGMVSHGVADESWHSLYADDGFIQTSAYTDFQGSYSQSHHNADIGAEMVVAHSFKPSFFSYHWGIPSADLVEIYAMANMTVTAKQIDRCMLLGYLGVQGVRLAGRYLYPTFANKSTFLVHHFRDHFRGGLMDMAAWVHHCWYTLENWIEEGPVTQFCKSMDLNWQPTQLLKRSANQQSLLFDQNNRSREINDPSNRKPIQHFVKLAHTAIIIKGIAEEIWSIVKSWFGYKECIEPEKIILDMNVSFAGLGKSFAFGDFNGDGRKELAISAPYYQQGSLYQPGAVFIMKNELVSGPVLEQYQQVLYGDDAAARFGYSLAIVDMNQDGIDDLAVSSPSFGSLSLDYTGKVCIYFGSKNGLNSTPSIVIEPKVIQPIHTSGRMWSNRFTNFGSILQSQDIDDDGFLDLIVQSPFASPVSGKHQAGQIHIYYASSKHIGKIGMDVSDISLAGSQDYEFFGSSVLFTTTKDSNISKDRLIIGSPGYRINETSFGRISNYKLENNAMPKLLFTLVSEFPNSNFGKTMSILPDGLIAISSCSQRSSTTKGQSFLYSGSQSGVIRLLNVSLFDQVQAIDRIITGSHPFGHFGEFLVSKKSQFWISEPLFLRESGRVYLFDAIEKKTKFCLQGSPLDRFGSSLFIADVNADGQDDLIVSTLSGQGTHSGSVILYFSRAT
jgi:glycosylphosphatidylinositol phospholipase D